MKPLSCAIATAVIGWLCTAALGQELNYNSFQRGTRSAMLGGAAVAGARDASAIFYNPAGLAFSAEDGFDLSAQAVRWESTDFRDLVGEGENVDTSSIDLIPLLLARHIAIDDENRFQLAVGLTSFQKREVGIQDLTRRTNDFLSGPDFPGTEQFSGRINNSISAAEYWASAGFAYRAGDHVSFGVSPIISYRQHRVVDQFSATLSPSPTLPISLSRDRVLDFYQFSYFLRFGVAWEVAEPLRFGFTASTPSRRIVGRGEVFQEEIITNGIVRADDSLGSLYGVGRQRGRDTNYRVPFHADFGIEWDFAESWTVATSIQYWDRLKKRAVVDVNPFEPFYQGVPLESGNSSSPLLTFYDARQEVINVSLGVEHHFDEANTGYFGFWTDFSPIEQGELKKSVALRQPFVTRSSVDVYNFITGLSHRGESSIITVGATVGFGTGRLFGPSVDFTSDDPSNLFGTPVPRKTDISLITAGVVFSYQYIF
ncbi:MAG: hypothetical protein RL885_18535 [Planctomycetota bacterium]